MNRERFLLYLLGGIFGCQVAIFGTGLVYCMNNGGPKTCPNISQSYEKTFNVMIATTLALLTGASLSNNK